MDPIKTAIDAMDLKALNAGDSETGHGWRHAALICRLNWTASRMRRQLQHHAAYHQATQPAKAAAYREADTLLGVLTGLPAAEAPRPVTREPRELFALPACLP